LSHCEHHVRMGIVCHSSGRRPLTKVRRRHRVIDPPTWSIEQGNGPLVAAAIHDGHAVRHELVERFALDEAGRLREEDPWTAEWRWIASTRIVVARSRFEVDMNRPRDKAVYLRSEDAWGLEVWKEPPPPEVIERSLALYDRFYQDVGGVLEDLSSRHDRVVVFDLHSYNHRREGPSDPPADPEGNPEVNLDRRRWQPVVESWIEAIREFEFLGRHLDVRENVKFGGGEFSRWIHGNFADSVCCLAIEVKKFFMDEWTGRPDGKQLAAIGAALGWAAGAVHRTLHD
jgi:N-formylglutamate deformylase